MDSNRTHYTLKSNHKRMILIIPKNGVGIYFSAELNNLCWSSVVMNINIDNSTNKSVCSSVVYSVVKPILVLGSGKIGRLLPEAFGGNSSCITTHRSEDLCTEDCAKGIADSVVFDMTNRDTWTNLPSTNTVIITFDLSNYDS